MYALDINSVDDMRNIARRSLMGGSPGPEDEQIEKEVETWVLAFMGEKASMDFEKEKEKARLEREGREREQEQVTRDGS